MKTTLFNIAVSFFYQAVTLMLSPFLGIDHFILKRLISEPFHANENKFDSKQNTIKYT